MSRHYYAVGELSAQDYPWLEETVETVAVQALLVSYDFNRQNTAYFTQRCRQLNQLGQALHQNLSRLQQQGHPKWQQVNPWAEVSDWQRDACMSSANRYKPSQQSDLASDLLAIIRSEQPPLNNPSGSERLTTR